MIRSLVASLLVAMLLAGTASAQETVGPVSIGKIVVTDRAAERDGPRDVSGELSFFASPAAFRSPCPWLKPVRKGRAAAPRGAVGRLTGTISRARDATYKTGPAAGEFRLTGSDGRRIWTQELSTSTGGMARLFERALQASLRSACQERRRISVVMVVSLDAVNQDARGSVVGRLEAVGVERLGPTGRVERGNFEFAEDVQWTTGDAAITSAGRCPVALTGVDLPPDGFGPPTALAAEEGRGYSVAVLPAINLLYAIGPPCGEGGDMLITSVATLPGLTIAVPGPGQAGRRTGSANLGTVSGSYAAEVTVTRLPPLPAPTRGR